MVSWLLDRAFDFFIGEEGVNIGRLFAAAVIGWAVYALFWAGVIYVGVHFTAKNW